jgi:hypothetical protein
MQRKVWVFFHSFGAFGGPDGQIAGAEQMLSQTLELSQPIPI